MKQPKMSYKIKTSGIRRGQGLGRESFNHLINRAKYETEKEGKLKKVNELDSEGSDYSVGVIVPSTKNGDEPISKKEFVSRVTETKKEMSNLFGGTTSIEQVGSYTLSNGSLIEEKGIAVVSNTDKEKFEGNKDKILDYAKNKGKNWTQESMGVTIETPKNPSKSLLLCMLIRAGLLTNVKFEKSAPILYFSDRGGCGSANLSAS